MKIPRILITAPKSGCGKTTVVCAVLSAFRKAGVSVGAAKCGPDYIDPMFHRAALGVESCNLDSFFADPPLLRSVLARQCVRTETADGLMVLEGAMGYFDGLGGVTSRAGSFEIGSVTETPAILVLDAKGAGASLAAEAEGFLHFHPDLCAAGCGGAGGNSDPVCSVREHNGIRGFILNRVSASFYPKLKTLLEEKTGVPVLGYLPPMPRFVLPSRHLGLCAPEDSASCRAWLEALSEQAESTLDLERIRTIARSAPDFREGEERVFEMRACGVLRKTGYLRYALAWDAAFSFVYRENVDFLECMGAGAVPFSPLADTALPPGVSGLILPGGYPERFAKQLSANRSMLDSVRTAVGKGMPCAAECGGFLYLMDSLEGEDGTAWPMAGVIHGAGYRTKGLCRFGYAKASILRKGLLGEEGTELRGHEFHHWDTDFRGRDMLLEKPLSGDTQYAVVHTETLAAGFPHFYYPGSPGAAAAFVRAMRKYDGGRQ